MTKESIPSRIRKYIDLKLENKETQESISNTNNKISNFKTKILRKLGYDQGLLGITISDAGGCPKLQDGSRRCRRLLEPEGHSVARRSQETTEGPGKRSKVNR